MTIEKIVVLLKQLTEEVQKLEKTPAAKTEYQEDSKIIALAKRYPFEGHILVNKSDVVKKYYITTLLSIFSSVNNNNLSKEQQLFICRIISSYDSQINIKEYITQSLKVDIQYFNNLVEVFDFDTAVCFAVDLMLLSLFRKERIIEKECELISDILQLLKINKETVLKTANIAKAIAGQNFTQLIQLIDSTDKINYSCFLAYYPENTYTSIVKNITDIKNMPGNILVVNAKISNYQDFIDLNEYKAEKISFYNCSFNNIRGFKEIKQLVFDSCNFENNIFNENTKTGVWGLFGGVKGEDNYTFINGDRITLKNTIFTNIRASKNILDLTNSNIENCKFINCQGLDVPCSYLIQMNTGEIKNSVFENCSIKTSMEDRNVTTGGIVLISNGIFKNNNLIKCSSKGTSSYGSYAKFKMQIVQAINAKVENCRFNEGYCSSDDSYDKGVTSYILGLKNSIENNNEFNECSSYHYSYGSIGSSHNVGTVE